MFKLLVLVCEEGSFKIWIEYSLMYPSSENSKDVVVVKRLSCGWSDGLDEYEEINEIIKNNIRKRVCIRGMWWWLKK